jgi:hypothetical protein
MQNTSHHFNYEISFIEIEAGFVDSPAADAILGQEGFFDAFKIKFEKDHNIIEITPSKRH